MPEECCWSQGDGEWEMESLAAFPSFSILLFYFETIPIIKKKGE